MAEILHILIYKEHDGGRLTSNQFSSVFPSLQDSIFALSAAIKGERVKIDFLGVSKDDAGVMRPVFKHRIYIAKGSLHASMYWAGRECEKPNFSCIVMFSCYLTVQKSGMGTYRLVDLVP